MRAVVVSSLVLGLLCATAAPAWGQRGVGQPEGVARQALRGVEIQRETLSGEVKSVQKGPCELTTGRAGFGMHLILQTEQKQPLNVHLGPVEVVSPLLEGLQPGQPVTVKAFRTKAMNQGHYVAETVTWDGRTVQLRGEDLRPVWAGPVWAGGRGRGGAGRVSAAAGRGGGWGQRACQFRRGGPGSQGLWQRGLQGRGGWGRGRGRR